MVLFNTLHLDNFNIAKLCATSRRTIFIAFLGVGWLQAILFLHLINYEIKLVNKQINNNEKQTVILPDFAITFPIIRKNKNKNDIEHNTII